MLYADYNYYTNTYMGNLSDDTFKSLIPKSSKMIDRSINTILDEENFKELSKKAQDSVFLLKFNTKYTVFSIYLKI